MDKVLAAVGQVGDEIVASPLKSKWGDVAKNLMAFEPVVDGDILPGIPERLIAGGASIDIPLLIGTNTDEGRLFFVPNAAYKNMSALIPRLFAWGYGARRPGTIRAYRRGRPNATPGELAMAIFTDGFYRMPAIRLAEKHPNSYLYEFAWTSGHSDGFLGASHVLELPFVFDNLDDPDVQPLLGRPAPQDLAETMHAAWIRFAKTGDPGWAPYTATARITMRFGEESHVTTDERSSERRVWAGQR
jgi:para-nitrobenzyl esterase